MLKYSIYDQEYLWYLPIDCFYWLKKGESVCFQKKLISASPSGGYLN